MEKEFTHHWLDAPSIKNKGMHKKYSRYRAFEKNYQHDNTGGAGRGGAEGASFGAATGAVASAPAASSSTASSGATLARFAATGGPFFATGCKVHGRSERSQIFHL